MRTTDLTRQRFGKLTVISQAEERENGYRVWNCLCDCGNTIKVSSAKLKKGTVQSCGCQKKKYPNRRGRVAEDLRGMRFGRLTVLERIADRGGRVCWQCRCDCGNTAQVTSVQLKSGNTKSCGCLRLEVMHTGKDLRGMRFGNLTAQYPTDKRDYKGSIYWHCRCDCGNETDVTEDRLLHGRYISCGCKKREAQERVGETLTFTDGTCIEWLRSRKSRKDNSSGFRGVYRRHDGTYKVGIGFKGRKYYLGVFSSFDDAVHARVQAEQLIHEAYIARYEKWAVQAEKAVKDGDTDWAVRNPLLFEVEKAGPGLLQITTADGVNMVSYI